MALSLSLLAISALGMFGFLILKPEITIRKVHLSTFYWAPTLGAILALIFGLVNYQDLWASLTASRAINPFEILILFFSMTYLSLVLDESGFFAYLASRVASSARHNQFQLFIFLYLLVSVLTIFTSNDIIILTFTPFLILLAKNAKIDSLPYLVSEFVAANTWSMLLLIGNPTNIYLAENAAISFGDYFLTMWPAALLGGSASFALMLLMFHRRLSTPIEATNKISALKDSLLAYVAGAILLLTLVAMAFSDLFSFPLWLISLLGAILLMVFVAFRAIKTKKSILYMEPIRRLPYSIVPFILSMFVIVVTLKEQGALTWFASFLEEGNSYLTVGLTSYFLTNVLNNIPMSVLYAELFNSVNASRTMVYLAIISSNVGAFFSPVGALAGVMWGRIIKNEGLSFSFKNWLTYLTPVSLIALLFSFLGLALLSL